MSLRSDLEILLKAHRAGNGSNTPEFILAMFLTECLAAFDKAVSGRRDKWGVISPQTKIRRKPGA